MSVTRPKAAAPYGVVSSPARQGRTGQGGRRVGPAGITLAEVMPPIATDERATGIPTEYGNVSVFTPVRSDAHGAVGVLAGAAGIPSGFR